MFCPIGCKQPQPDQSVKMSVFWDVTPCTEIDRL
jgi:hypothetical protein